MLLVTRSSSSSSSSSSQARKKKSKKAKKGDKKASKKVDKKQDKKSDKKSEKKAKKVEKKAKRTQSWDCDRAEAARLIGQLLQLDDGIADELRGVFQQIDDGDAVRIDGLENRQARKKLRHLFQALGLSPTGDQGFRTANKKVSFTLLFEEGLSKAARASGAAGAAEPGPQVAEAAPAASITDDVAAASSPVAAEVAAPPEKKLVGPRLPGADIGPAAHSESEDEKSDDVKDHAGPRMAGEERRGVDLNDLPERGVDRQAWMTMCPEAMAGAFGDGGSSRKTEKFEIKRSAEEEAQFEKMYAQRGSSLLTEQREQKFAGHEEEMDHMRKRKVGPSEMWGMTAQDQERGSLGAGGPSQKAGRLAFDPEKDMKVTKPMSGAEFTSLVENSASSLTGRFSRAHVATSFL